MNFSMAAEMLMLEGIDNEILTVSDDIASAPRESWEDRRGIAGIVLVYKIAGACAKAGLPLLEVKRVVRKAIEYTASLGVAFSSCVLPDVGKDVFSIGDDEMEFGMGIHGEPGIERRTMQTSAQIANHLVDAILDDLSIQPSDKIAVLVNGLGSTSREELYLFYHDVFERLKKHSVEVRKVLIGEFTTSLEMAGASLSVMKIDDELEQYLNASANTPFANFNI